MRLGPNQADGWVTEFAQHPIGHGDPNTWVQSFEQEHGVNGWASEFEHEQRQLGSADHVRGATIPTLVTMEQIRMLAHTLAQNNDPKFQLSKGPDGWVNEFASERGLVDDEWVNEFSKLHVNGLAEEFGHQVAEGAFGDSSADNWANAYDELLQQ